MKTKHWILVCLAIFMVVGSPLYSLWFKANAQVFFMPSVSMTPTIPFRAQVIGWMHVYDAASPRRDDIAVIQLPRSLAAPGTGSGTSFFVKRVVGVPGDSVELKGGVLTLNGVVHGEPFVQWIPGPRYDMKILGGQVYSRESGGLWTRGDVPASSAEQQKLDSSPTQPIPPERFLILGDNRGNSNDSHVFGLVPRSMFKGRVGQQIWPRLRLF